MNAGLFENRWARFVGWGLSWTVAALIFFAAIRCLEWMAQHL